MRRAIFSWQSLAGIAGPLVGTPVAAILCFSMVFFFGGFAYTAGAAAIQKVTPARLRARMAALYLFVVSLFATTLGPTSIALLTDHLFNSPAKVGYSMSVVAAIVGPIGCAVFLLGLRPFARAIAEQSPAN